MKKDEKSVAFSEKSAILARFVAPPPVKEARASGRPRSEDDMIELKDDSAAVLNREFFAEAGDALPADLADYDAPDKGAGEYASILSDGEGGVAPAS